MTGTAPPTSPPERDSDLPEFLASRARAASDARLAVDTTIGLIAVLVSIVWPFPFWYFVTAAGGCFLGFGLWGIADRELSERGTNASRRVRDVLRAARVLATVVGAASAAVLAVMVMAFLIGRVIS
jgi:hypothetical protein